MTLNLNACHGAVCYLSTTTLAATGWKRAHVLPVRPQEHCSASRLADVEWAWGPSWSERSMSVQNDNQASVSPSEAPNLAHDWRDRSSDFVLVAEGNTNPPSA